jgi:hypothetical protein
LLSFSSSYPTIYAEDGFNILEKIETTDERLKGCQQIKYVKFMGPYSSHHGIIEIQCIKGPIYIKSSEIKDISTSNSKKTVTVELFSIPGHLKKSSRLIIFYFRSLKPVYYIHLMLSYMIMQGKPFGRCSLQKIVTNVEKTFQNELLDIFAKVIKKDKVEDSQIEALDNFRNALVDYECSRETNEQAMLKILLNKQ